MDLSVRTQFPVLPKILPDALGVEVLLVVLIVDGLEYVLEGAVVAL